MLRNDLRGYVLLGDPAARLPLAKNALGFGAKDAEGDPKPQIFKLGKSAESIAESAIAANILSATNVPAPPSALTAIKEEAVFSLIQGEEAPITIARRAGTTVVELFSWFDAYRSGGRSQL